MPKDGAPIPGDRPAPTGLPARSRRVKRGFDIIVAACGLALLALPFLVIACAIRIDSPGPVFYTQWRGGLGGRPFRICKFRTMVVNADGLLGGLLPRNVHAHDPRLYKIPDDPRVTRFGGLLRRFSLDELPQLVNVLKGEMSLVGPRPLMLSEDRHVRGADDIRRTVRPGITGPWQVGGRNELSFETMMRLDCAYIAQWSFRGDLRLLMLTLPAALRRQRAG